MAAGKNAFDLNKQLVGTFISDKDSLKARLDSYFKDEAQPFEERFEIFKTAPVELCGSDPGIFHPESEKLLDSGEVSWFDDFYCERYTEVDMVEKFWGKYADDYTDPDNCPKGYTPEFFEALKRELVSKNIRSFTLDW
jgi:hypothetical protein